MKYTTKVPHFFCLLMLCLLFSFSVSAATLQDVKRSGLVGEKANGYIGVVTNASAEVKALVQSVNQKRRNKYQAIARANSTSLQAIESVAGKKTMQKTPVGQYIYRNGTWLRK